jgi:anaerobic dimethyl sulfoxide reductase subunit B (iron-sulfur subunit)
MRIKMIEKGKFPELFAAYLASPCYHCSDPVCVKACPEQAIARRDEDGIVVVDREKCTGKEECPKRCLKACPYDAPQFGPEANAKMVKCDLCLDRITNGEIPICVGACPMMAIDVGPLDELESKYECTQEAEGFTYSKTCKPAVVFKPKPCTAKELK